MDRLDLDDPIIRPVDEGTPGPRPRRLGRRLPPRRDQRVLLMRSRTRASEGLRATPPLSHHDEWTTRDRASDMEHARHDAGPDSPSDSPNNSMRSSSRHCPVDFRAGSARTFPAGRAHHPAGRDCDWGLNASPGVMLLRLPFVRPACQQHGHRDRCGTPAHPPAPIVNLAKYVCRAVHCAGYECSGRW